jgi:ectoine hydroxylase-related dioxygenase (phytanoyl-CoA dioxygenase family)
MKARAKASLLDLGARIFEHRGDRSDGRRTMIEDADVAFYREQGYLVVRDVLSGAEVEELRRVTEQFVEDARSRTAHDEIYDLEDSHSAREPRVRRIKTPHLWHEAYARAVAHPGILEVLKGLWGPSIRFDVSKLNLKAAGYGAPVEWHQDWAFYPHTNDDLAAVGIMLDDVGDDNGPLMVIPGTHRGPILDHHDDEGYFCGAIDPARAELDFSSAVKLTGVAGSITVHHARLVHGSATNTSGRPRRLLLHQYRAADAWPILGVPDFAQFREQLLCGEDTLEPRLEKVPVRLPLPPARHQGSIYENQKTSGRRFFQTADELEPALGE